MTVSDRVRVKNVEILSDDYYLLKKTTFEYRRANGEWQTQARETYDRGNCATVLPYNLAQRTVILVRQFRYPAYVNGYDDLLIEAAAGILDGEAPDVRIRAEAVERLNNARQDPEVLRLFNGLRQVVKAPRHDPCELPSAGLVSDHVLEREPADLRLRHPGVRVLPDVRRNPVQIVKRHPPRRRTGSSTRDQRPVDVEQDRDGV